jgi:regulator of cell morphogenesis and NO signaling
MTPIDPTASLADLVLAAPRRAELFERLRLDYCCGGARSLADACARRGLDADTIVAVIAAYDDGAGTGAMEQHDVARASLGDLCDHIVKAHHDHLRRELPRTAELLAKVVRVHGSTHRELHDLQRVFDSLRAELERHMEAEETIVFPACRALEQQPGAHVNGAVLVQMEGDHAGVADALIALRELSDGYRLDRASCATHRALLEALQALELDLHQHIHEENNVLFPRARAMAAAA